MKLLTGCFLFIVFFMQLQSQDMDFLFQIRNETKLENDEVVVVIYQNLGVCSKCYVVPIEIISKATQNLKNKKFKLLVLLNCSRDKELKIFIKDYDWKHYILRDDGSAREKLGATNNTIITITDYYGRNLLNIEPGNSKASIEKLREILNSI